MAASIWGMPFAIERTILIDWTGGHFRGAFCLLFLRSEMRDTSEAPPRQTLNADWAKKRHRGALESTRRHTLNAPQLSNYPDTEPTSSCPILIMLNVWLRNDKYKTLVIGLTIPGFKPVGSNTTI